MANKFSKNLVKTYKYWEIHVHENQSYLGRCYVWCKRKSAADLTDASPKEQKELFLILCKLREASQKIFRPNWFNYSFLGNETPHLHCHFIPRYAKPRTFRGVVFKDSLYGHNYKTDHSFKTPTKLLIAVRDKYIEALRQHPYQ